MFASFFLFNFQIAHSTIVIAPAKIMFCKLRQHTQKFTPHNSFQMCHIFSTQDATQPYGT